MDTDSLAGRQMAAYLMAYMEFSNNVALAMNDYPETGDVEKMLEGITAAWRMLDEKKERIEGLKWQMT